MDLRSSAQAGASTGRIVQRLGSRALNSEIRVRVPTRLPILEGAKQMKCPNCGHELTLPHSKPIRDKVVELFDQGLSIDQIAAELYKDYNLRYGYPIRRPEQNVRLHLIKAGRLVRPNPPNFDKRGQ